MKTRLSEKMNAIWPIKKILETFEKKVGSRKIPFSTWSDHLEISDFMRGISSTNLVNKEVSVQAKLKIDLSKLRH